MAVKVYDNARQQVVEVPSAEAQRGIMQGEYSSTGAIRVAKGNQTGEVDPDGLLTAIGQGARIVDDDEALQIQIARDESDTASQILGGAEAAAAGATFGLSSQLESMFVDPERMAARREVLGKGGTALELLGAAAPALLTGGASTGASAGAAGVRAGGLASRIAAATPAGAVARGAARFEAGLAARLGSESGAVAKILPSGARNFVEGVAQGVGTEIDEAALGDRELAADRLVASGIMGGLFGGGTAVAVPGLAKIAAGAVKAPIDGMRKVLGRGNAASGGLASREIAEVMAGGASGLSPQARAWKVAAKANGLDEEVAHRLATLGDTAEGRAQINRIDRDMPRIEREAAELIADRVPSVHRQMDEARRHWGGASKVDNWERQIAKSPEAIRAAGFAVDDLFAGARNGLNAIIEKNTDDLARFGATTHSAPMLKAADEAVGKLHLEIVEAEKLAGAAKVARKAAAVDGYKRRLGEIVEENGGWGAMRQATPEVRATNADLRKMYGGAKELLEREDVFGSAAIAQREINASYAQMAQADDLFREATAGSGLGTIVNPDGSMNIGKALKLVRAHGRIGGDVTVTRLMDAMDARVRYFDEIGKHIEVDDAGRAAQGKIRKDVADLRAEFKRQSHDAAIADDLKAARLEEGNKSPSIGMLSTAAPTLAGLAGFAAGGPIGAAIGAAAGAATRPYTSLRAYAAMRSLLDKTDSRISGVVSGLFQKTANGASRLKAITLPRAPYGALGALVPRSRAENVERRETALARAAEMVRSPEALGRALDVPMADLQRAAPGVAGVMQQRVQAAAAFLASKAPKVYQRPFSTSKPLVDPVSAASFERYLEAVVDPIAALERVQAGRLTAETAEAIRVVYPALYRDIQSRVVDELSRAQADGREIPYERRINLGLLFQIPSDPSLQASVGTEIQNAIGAHLDEPDAATVMAAANKPSGKAGKIEANPERLETSADHTATWRLS